MNIADLPLDLAADVEGPASLARPWQVLIVDDESGVHQVTEMALRDVQVVSRPLQFLHAYSAAEARALLRKHPDIALVLLDVVMENDHAGLELVEFIRHELNNALVRIILRTGQPGQAPEREVIIRYDINGYTYKAELTTTKLFSTVYTAIAAYRDLMALQHSREVYKKIVLFAARLQSIDDLAEIAEIALKELAALLYLDQHALCAYSTLAASSDTEQIDVLVATGEYATLRGPLAPSELPPPVRGSVLSALSERRPVFDERGVTGYCETAQGLRVLLHVCSSNPSLPRDDDHELIDLFCKNVAVAIERICRLG